MWYLACGDGYWAIWKEFQVYAKKGKGGWCPNECYPCFRSGAMWSTVNKCIGFVNFSLRMCLEIANPGVLFAI